MACLHRKHAKQHAKIFVIESWSLCPLASTDIIHVLSVLDYSCLKNISRAAGVRPNLPCIMNTLS